MVDGVAYDKARANEKKKERETKKIVDEARFKVKRTNEKIRERGEKRKIDEVGQRNIWKYEKSKQRSIKKGNRKYEIIRKKMFCLSVCAGTMDRILFVGYYA